ncbi:transposase [Yoonia sp. BS5-3]|uniref:Transposase n=1 Tax=Yoonia phaeophyticola TaxID=3137369 RepID=A0ABZ2V2P9_9RHOB
MTLETRRYVPGGTYFFTVRLQDMTSDLFVREVELLRSVTRLCMKRWPYKIAAAVVLPSQVHMIWVLPDGDADFSKRWRLIKSGFSRHVPAPDYVAPSQFRRGEKGIWQRGFWEHRIRDVADFDRHMHVIATAPVQAGLVKRVGDWPLSSVTQHKRNAEPVPLRTTVPAQADLNPIVAELAN